MNRLPLGRRAQIIKLLVEGNSLRATSRLADCSINTITKLLVDIGAACAAYQDDAFRNLSCKRIQVDEIWSFVYAKQKNVPEGMEDEAGDAWTWTAIDAETKLVPTWLIGDRTYITACTFIDDLAARLASRIQLTSDGHKAYVQAVEESFGDDIDYAQLVKIYGDAPDGKKSYRAQYIGAERKHIIKVIKKSVEERVNGLLPKPNYTRT